MTNKRIIKEAKKILESLNKLQIRCVTLSEQAQEGRWLPPHIQGIISTLEDLANFDLEDCIVC